MGTIDILGKTSYETLCTCNIRLKNADPLPLKSHSSICLRDILKHYQNHKASRTHYAASSMSSWKEKLRWKSKSSWLELRKYLCNHPNRGLISYRLNGWNQSIKLIFQGVKSTQIRDHPLNEIRGLEIHEASPASLFPFDKISVDLRPQCKTKDYVIIVLFPI